VTLLGLARTEAEREGDGAVAFGLRPHVVRQSIVAGWLPSLQGAIGPSPCPLDIPTLHDERCEPRRQPKEVGDQGERTGGRTHPQPETLQGRGREGLPPASILFPSLRPGVEGQVVAATDGPAGRGVLCLRRLRTPLSVAIERSDDPVLAVPGGWSGRDRHRSRSI
jgi:hypothetical protein